MLSIDSPSLAPAASIQATLEMTYRYRILVPEMFSHSFSFKNDAEAHSLVQTLAEQRLLAKAPFCNGHHYYYLTPAGINKLGVSTADTRPLKACHHAIAYGTLHYGTQAGSRRRRLTKEEFICDFPDLYQPGPQINYLIEPDGLLSFVRLDGDLSSSKQPGCWERVFQTVNKLCRQRQRVPAFAELIKKGLFQVVVLAALPEKVEQMNFRLNELREQYESKATELPPPQMAMHYVPGLLDLMRPRPNRPR